MKKWWQETVVYQIYPRSFQDSNGDGIGDIPGITSRLPELAELGAGVLWLSPVYKSPQIDNGYDISDYRDIDPIFGTMSDMENLIAEAGKRGIKIIMDLVINHTSDEHDWFQKSRRRENGYEDYYIWKPGKKDRRNLPNNWTSFFMEDAWSFDEIRREYYLHLFHKKQPDLNYRNPKVLEEVKNILKFWLDKGVAGFRCDVINVLWKTSLADGKKSLMLTGLEHYKCQEGNHEILRTLRKEVLDPRGAFTVGETAMVNLEEAKLLSDAARRELDMVFYFDHLEMDRRFARFIPKKFRAGELLARLAKWQRGLEWNAVYLENHDQSRIVSHYGSGRGKNGQLYWERSAKLLAVLEFTLRGTPFIYQGQEIGMTNFDFTGLDQVKDIETHNLNRLMKKLLFPAWLRWKWLRLSSRDNARTPVQWDAGPGAGFTGAAPWLGINSNYGRINYHDQKNDAGSVLSFYKMMIRFRAGSGTIKYGEFRPLYAKGPIIAYERRPAQTPRGGDGESFVVLLNFSGKKTKLSGAAAALCPGTVILSNTGREALSGTARAGQPPFPGVPAALEPWEAVVVRTPAGR
ncbi:MAG: alpha-glucosidase [Treponema sp.]|jgi:oligo-1,6-glucosidase|nr:alpha-glucosidase [Treponema sp.]